MKLFGVFAILMASADAGLGGGGGGGDTALAEISPSGGGESSTGADLTLVDDSVPAGGENALATLNDGPDGTAAQPGEFRAIEGGKLTKPASAGIAYLKEKPEYAKLANIIPNALAIRAKLFGILPGNPFKAIEAMQRTIKDLGGEKGIAKIRTELADVEENDSLYAAGDARLLQKMTETPAAKAAFLKMVPHALSLFQQLAPNRYWAYMAQVTLWQMKNAKYGEEELDLPFRLKRLASLIPKENVAALEEMSALLGYVALLRGNTQLVGEEMESAPDVNAERTQLEKDRQQLLQDSFVAGRNAIMNQIYTSEWVKQTAGRTMTARQEQNIQSNFARRLNVARRNIPDYRATIDSFLASKDKAGFEQMHRDFFLDKIPQLLAHEIKEELGVATRRPAAAADTTTTTPAAGAVDTTAPAKGFTKVKLQEGQRAPGVNDLKRGPKFTTTDSYSKKQGFASRNNQWKLAEGTPVTW